MISSIAKHEFIYSNKNNFKYSMKNLNLSGDNNSLCPKPTAQPKNKEYYKLQCFTHDFAFEHAFLKIHSSFI